MSLDLVVLTRGTAGSFDQAVAVYSEQDSGTPDESGELETYAREVYDATTTQLAIRGRPDRRVWMFC